MSLENFEKRRDDIEEQLGKMSKQVTDLRTQITNAENQIKQWTDTMLILRGQLLEIDNIIKELRPPEEDEKVEEK